MEEESVTTASPLQFAGVEITLEKVAGIWTGQNYSKQVSM
jgi:hypothetical protein